MNWVNQWLGAEIYFVYVGHGVLFWAVLAIIAMNVPWWAMVLGLPVAIGSVIGWAAETRVILPVANRLLKGESPGGMTATVTTAPSGK
ncbi:MAG TPA: hypothetical protein VMR52_12965 [Dehalococcoidia bacterium]|nr:hypothetical protein [Dehalococcoidia bacterium]